MSTIVVGAVDPPSSTRKEEIRWEVFQYPNPFGFHRTFPRSHSRGRRRNAFWSLNPKSAPDSDRMTWRQYEADPAKNLEVLHEKLCLDRLKSLRECDVHMTHIPTPGDEAGLRRLDVHLTSDPNFSTKNLFVS